MSEKIGSRTVKPKTPVLPQDVRDESNSKKLAIAAKINSQVTLGGLLSRNKVIFRNWMIDEMRALFPNQPAMWHVEKMIQLSSGKKLLIDEPQRDWEIQESKAKAPHLKELGFIYVAIMSGKTIGEALADAGVDKLE